MKSYLAALPLIVPLVSASPVTLGRRNSDPLDLELSRDGNTGVKATITNAGNIELKLFVPGTILDKSPVEKVAVYSGNDRVPFDGVRLRMAPPGLITNKAFRTLAPNETVTLDFDFAQMHDVSPGGEYNLTSKGAIPYAVGNTTRIVGYVPYKSNVLNVQSVNGTLATIARREFHAEAKRIVIQSGCTADQEKATTDALIHCTNLAKDATRAVARDNRRMKEYFKATDMNTKRVVQAVFTRIAKECGTRLLEQSVSKLYCTDVYNSCKDGVLAYTLPSQSYMVNCPLFFNALPSLTPTCHAQDQATTTLHEMTHLAQIKGTLDYGTYGYEGIKKLPADQNINHADTYCLFANSVNLGAIC
ncbi:deuterolysin metalloprotease [Colletotrichum truncatum]|uniref:Deuterolysin metalloprotease n=1 Tax=Colletotrichum truncatum TaxID=5467 RepID=A0ACC3Z2I0_COLTU|nr:deuterolysin metalloprotease [Colletotrichum truncatum]KAF6782705.1 deuterolysin metalloprotease [Colletotrichum truncatum]